MKSVISLSLILMFVSCATDSHKMNYKKGRTISSTQVFSRFLQKIATQTNKSAESLESTILQYIRNQQKNSSHGNWSAIGITQEQSKQIKSLTDDHPFMNRVRKWVTENIDVATSVQKSVAAKVFDDVINAENTRGLTNPYKLSVNESSAQLTSRQQQTSPFRSITHKQDVILKDIESIKDKGIQKLHRKNLAEFQKRGSESPSVHANGQEIVQSATVITRKTGLKAMGDGCEEFTQNAAAETLAIKADVDLYRAQLIEDLAHDKAGRSFASVDDIPADKRLTQEELDYATQKSFQDVLGYTDDEARVALRRLKSKPCRLY